MESPFLATLIPSSRLAEVQKAVIQTFNQTDVDSIVLLAGGYSASSVYKITIKNKSYVLKSDDTAVQINPGVACMEIAAKAGIAPHLYYLNIANGLSITDYVESKPLRAAFASPDVLIIELAKTIRTIHSIPLFPKKVNLSDTVEMLIEEVKKYPVFTKDTFKEVFKYYELIREYYPWDDSDQVSSHNDLNPNNIVYDGEKIWIIDWDAAFQNDRYVDLAIIANFFVSAEEQENLFLEAYFSGTLDTYKRARFFIMRQICLLVYAILMFRLAYMSNPNDAAEDPEMQTASLREIEKQFGAGKLSLSSYRGQLLYGQAFLNEMLKNMQSARFTISIEHLISKES
ncbi:phosphotransferase [Pedobacter sp. PAMC26386]|nr:phosphotransferase [Pedobacter sp. PAMC26386]